MSELLVEVTRGPILESTHRGSVAVVNSAGKLLYYAGDPFQIVCMRSASKPIQALNVILSGAADRYGFSDKELSIMCASHYGEQFHRDVILGLLEKLGLKMENLHCGIEPKSINLAYMLELVAQGFQWDQYNSDCSGKHCGFLASCLTQDFTLDTYDQPEHPLQQQVLGVVAEMCGIEPEKILLGTDGCGVPVHGLPLYNMALGYAKLANPENLSPEYKSASERITAAMNAAPEMLAGTNGFCTALVKNTNGKAVGKVGAEAVYGVGLLGKDIGFAAKIDDGNASRALYPVVMDVMKRLDVLTEAELASLSGYVSPIDNMNAHDRVIGEIRTAFQLKSL